jgi:hypothetical protein
MANEATFFRSFADEEIPKANYKCTCPEGGQAIDNNWGEKVCCPAGCDSLNRGGCACENGVGTDPVKPTKCKEATKVSMSCHEIKRIVHVIAQKQCAKWIGKGVSCISECRDAMEKQGLKMRDTEDDGAAFFHNFQRCGVEWRQEVTHVRLVYGDSIINDQHT